MGFEIKYYCDMIDCNAKSDNREDFEVVHANEKDYYVCKQCCTKHLGVKYAAKKSKDH